MGMERVGEERKEEAYNYSNSIVEELKDKIV